MLSFPCYYVLMSLKIVLILANSADPDEMQHYAAFHHGLHCQSLRLTAVKLSYKTYSKKNRALRM